MESRTDPMAPNTIGDDSADAEIYGEQEPLKIYEDGQAPPPGALDTAFPDTIPTENPQSDPGLLRGSRDPSVFDSENDGEPGPRNGSTPFDAEGTSGSEGG